jgi:hypothetical protein
MGGGMSDYDLTLNFGLKKPHPGADADIWGDHVNQNMDVIDANLATGQGPPGPEGPPGPPGDDYTLPIASTDILGGVMVDGDSIQINAIGVISATGGGGFPGGDAPLDNVTYGRHMADWKQVIAADNDLFDGGNF